MGHVTVAMHLTTPAGRSRTVEMLVDSGAAFSCLPQSDWQALGLEKQSPRTFILADGSRIERSVSECRFHCEGRSATSPVVLGEAGDMALLGVFALQSLGLLLNPYDRTLRPVDLLLAGYRSASTRLAEDC